MTCLKQPRYSKSTNQTIQYKYKNTQKQGMGSCLVHKKNTQKPLNQFKSLTNIGIINDKQLGLLRLLYADSASRSASGQMSMENFLLFFHKNGYWGERLFKEFDTGNTNTVLEEEFVRGIVKIFKTSEQKKIQLLYKFFSQNNPKQGISFQNFLKMVPQIPISQLYNYPKQQIYKVMNDSDFINNQLKRNLISLDKDALGRRYESLLSKEVFAGGGGVGRLWALEEEGSQKIDSGYGAKIIMEMNKKQDQRSTTVNFNAGLGSFEVKTTSVHQLVKKFAKSIFKKYQVNEKIGRLKYESFRDWVMNHKILYSEYYKGFHSEVWEVDKITGQPLFTKSKPEFSSKAEILLQEKSYNVVISILQSILIVCHQDDLKTPLTLISLEGLSASIINQQNRYGIEISHRDCIYQKKKFYLATEQLQQQWMGYLKYFKGQSANQLYQFKQQIGVGKFSIVYHCTQKKTNQSYAIKVIQSYKLDDEARRIISHESSIMSLMSHPLLVFFKETIVTKTHIYIVTELVKGKDLFGFVKEFKFLGEAQASYILQQIIIGVRYIHSLGIVHRDLKAENIMIQYMEKQNKIGNIKIIDFGFASYLTKLKQLQKQQLLVGTPNYIAPQILKHEHLNQKIDNFAIGSILYYMLSGNLPFNSIDVSIILQKTIDGSFPLNDRHWRKISAEAKDLVEKLLENDPKERISLSDALLHPWLTMHRANRSKYSGMYITKNIENQQKDKPNRESISDALIF